MSSLLNLFFVLDGWDETRIDVPVLLQPDPALMAAHKAIDQRAGMDEALAAVEEQIDIARPVLRGLLFGVVKASQGNASPQVLRNMLCDLHLTAARITMHKRQWDEARSHLLHATACESGSPVPKLMFVELYVETGEYLSAIATLEEVIKEKGEVAFSLFDLASDLADRGARKEAQLCFDRIIETDEIGTIAALACIRLADLGTMDFEPPSESQMEELCQSGVRAMQEGEVQRALHTLFRVLSLRPREGRVWFFVGYILFVGVQEPEHFRERANASIKLKDISISAERYKELLQAEQALKLACAFNPDLIEARVQLASCYLLLNRPNAVLECAEQIFQQRPNQAGAYSLLSQVLLGVGDPLRAAMAAREALELDPEDPLAHRTLSILESALQQEEDEE